MKTRYHPAILENVLLLQCHPQSEGYENYFDFFEIAIWKDCYNETRNQKGMKTHIRLEKEHKKELLVAMSPTIRRV